MSRPLNRLGDIVELWARRGELESGLYHAGGTLRGGSSLLRTLIGRVIV